MHPVFHCTHLLRQMHTAPPPQQKIDAQTLPPLPQEKALTNANSPSGFIENLCILRHMVIFFPLFHALLAPSPLSTVPLTQRTQLSARRFPLPLLLPTLNTLFSQANVEDQKGGQANAPRADACTPPGSDPCSLCLAASANPLGPNTRNQGTPGQ